MCDLMAEEEKDLPVFTTSNTSGLTSILQLTDDTPNEVFTIRYSTSATEKVLIVEAPVEEESASDEREED